MKFESFFNKKRPENTETETGGLTRRSFLRQVASFAGGVAFAGSAIQVEKIVNGKTLEDYRRDVEELTSQSELTERVLVLKQRIQAEYGINLELTEDEMHQGSSALHYGHSELRISKQIEALEALGDSLAEYPSFMIKQSGLKNVVITAKPKSLNEGETYTAGYVAHGHLESSGREYQPEMTLSYDWNDGNDVPDKFGYEDTVYKELSKGANREISKLRKKEYFKKMVHHELTHFFIDVPGTESSPRLEEEKFAQGWKEKFGTYLERMRKLYEQKAQVQTKSGNTVYNYSKIIETPPGFTDGYGLTNLDEDRATVMQSIMEDRSLGINEIGSGDDILSDKVAMLKKFYFNQSCGLMDDGYWNLADSEDNVTSELLIPKDTKEINTRYFKERALYIVSTPYQYSTLTGEVSEETYIVWQQKLAKAYPYQYKIVGSNPTK